MARPIGLAFFAAAALALAVNRAPAQEGCKFASAGTLKAVAVRDGRTLLLDDGRELRLAGIELAGDSRTALEGLVAGQPLRLESLGTDRYGRLVGFAFAGEVSLQQALLEQGQALVSARIGNRACADAFLEAERAARAARRGFWADPNFAPLQAENLHDLETKRGQFALVEGKVLSVRESGNTIYVNFGRQVTRDFSLLISRRLQKSFTAAGLEPKNLQGRRIRVRGWLERRGGPAIQAEAPEQIEIIDRGVISKRE